MLRPDCQKPTPAFRWRALCFALLMAAAPGNAQTPSAGDITVGMSAALSGPAKSLGRNMKLGIETYFARINATQGVLEGTLRLVTRDDGYVPDVAALTVPQLIRDEGVLAILGNVGTPTAKVTVPIVNKARVLLLGAFTGAGLLRLSPPDRYVVNYRASYAEETSAMVDGLLSIGIRPYEIAFFSQNDSYGDAGYYEAIKTLESKGLHNASQLPHGRYERNTVDIEDGLMTILDAEIQPRAIIMIGAYAPCAKFIRLARRVLPRTFFLNVSFVGSVALAQALGDTGDGVIVTQVVPHFKADLPLTRAYLADMEEFHPEAEPGFVSLEGYIVAKIFVEGARRASLPLSRESIVDAIEALGDFDLGLGVPISYSATKHQASHSIWPTIIQGGAFHPLDWRDLKGGILP